MARICGSCGFQTQDDQQEICPFCGATLQRSSEQVEETLSTQKRHSKLEISIGPLLMPLILIAVMVSVLVYIFVQPEQVERQIGQINTAVQEKAAQMEIAQQEGQGQQEAEEEAVATDPSGNEIITDFQIPGVSVQPEYVLAESAHTTWTVATSGGKLNLRAGPGTEYDILSQVDEGVQVVGCGYSTTGPSNWIVVEINGQYGWACADYLKQN